MADRPRGSALGSAGPYPSGYRIEEQRNRRAMGRVTKMDEQERVKTSEPGPSVSKPRAVDGEERNLVRQAQKGDKEAFETLVQRHQHRVFAVARGILKRQEDVEDIAQQVFVKAYFSLKRFDQRAAFSTWLYKITLNECWDLLRKKKVRPLVFEAELSEEQSQVYRASSEQSDGKPDAGERLAVREQVEDLMSCLDERDRTMLVLKEVQG